MGHLADEAMLDDYNALITSVLSQRDSVVYHYPFGLKDYYAVSGRVAGPVWLVIFGTDAAMETAFPPDNFDDYVQKRGFVPLGRIEEIAP